MLIIPIRTESVSRGTPTANYVLLAVNVLVFLLLGHGALGRSATAFQERYLVFESTAPSFLQFFTYQFLHADFWHLFGNMLFLWVFGNSVNTKMGDVPYVLFYLSGGVFAAWGYAAVQSDPFRLLGASGAISAVTAAYLVLFPRSRVTLLLWFFFIHFFELPAMVLICFKIIAWDNIFAPMLSGAGQVAHQAHLAGYLFGFLTALTMLIVRALPRDQFDILALWKRWNQRREFAAAMADPAAAARARLGTAARVAPVNTAQRQAEEQQLDRITVLRGRISELLDTGETAAAAEAYEELVALDPKQCLSERMQLVVARAMYAGARFPQAAAAFERFTECYKNSRELPEVRLLLGIIFARDLQQYEMAKDHLVQAVDQLRDPKRKAQCKEWLEVVQTASGKATGDL